MLGKRIQADFLHLERQIRTVEYGQCSTSLARVVYPVHLAEEDRQGRMGAHG